MEGKPLPTDLTPDQESLWRHVFASAQGDLIDFATELESAPSLSDMEANTWGYYGDDIYIKTKSGTGIKLAGASFS